MEIYKFTGTDFSSKVHNFLADSLISGNNIQVSYVGKKEYRIVKKEKCTLSLTRRIVHLFLRVVTLNLIYILAKNKNGLIDKKVKPLFSHELDGQNEHSPINFRDTLVEISKFLGPKDLRNLNLASTHHNQVLSKNATHYLNYNPDVGLNYILGLNTPEKCVDYIKENAPRITSLCFTSPNTKPTTFFGDVQSKELLSAMISCKKLTRLNISFRVYIADQQLKLLGQCTSIRDLRLFIHDDTTDQGFACIQNLKHLETLKLSSPFTPNLGLKVTDVGLQALNNLQKLKNLDILQLDSVGRNVAYEGVCKLKNLEKLEFQCSSFPLKAFTNFSNLTNLKTLVVFGLLNDCNIEEISKLTQLEKLYLIFKNYHVGKKEFAKLSSLKNLKVLKLEKNYFLTDEILEVIAGFSQIRVLAFRYCRPMKEKSIEKLSKLKQLKEINFEGTGVPDNISEMVSKKFASSPIVRD